MKRYMNHDDIMNRCFLYYIGPGEGFTVSHSHGLYGAGGSYGGEGGSEDESHDPPLPAGQFNRPNNFGSNGAQGSYNETTYAGKKI